jgi:beta-glucosidase
MTLLSPTLFSCKDFGDDFVWGVASSAFQTEGAFKSEGKGLSIWDVFAQKQRFKIKDFSTPKHGNGFYENLEADIALLKELNVPAFRHSIAWSRILPEGNGAVNTKGLDFYNRMIDLCLEKNIEPWLTLYHWDLPYALHKKGGWTNRDILHHFEKFAEICAKNFGDRVKNWMVFNEPNAFVVLGYLLGIHAPGNMSLKKFLAATHHVALCHGLGGNVLKSEVAHSKVGSTFYSAVVDAYKQDEKNEMARKKADVLFNRLFLEPILGMGYPVQDLPLLNKMEPFIQQGDMEQIPFSFDFIGIQHYTRFITKYNPLIPIVNATQISAKGSGKPVTAMGWEIYPEGIYRVIQNFKAYPNMPELYITENGAAFKDVVYNGEIEDDNRIAYLQDYLAQVLKAKQEGVNIKGYFVWSFIDNFELGFGYKAKFGLVATNKKTHKRLVKKSGKWFAEFLK